MPKMKYPLDKGGPRRIEVSWKGNWKELTIRLDGNEIGSIANHEQLKAGQEIFLEDGSSLKVQLDSKSIFTFLRIFRDGKPLPSPGPEPAQRLSIAYKFIFLIAAANLIAGLSGLLFHSTLWKLPPAGPKSIVIGCIFLVLAFFVIRRSTVALAIAVGILALDVLLAVILRHDLPRFVLIAAVVFRVFVLLAMVQGFGAIKALKQNQPQTSD